MSTRPPHGNLTAALVVVALLEVVVDRLFGRLFATSVCRSVAGCLLVHAGPFLLYLTGVLALVVVAGGIAGHLARGEFFPRGVRFTVAALSLIFLLLVGWALAFGRTPTLYQTPLETSFGLVMALVGLSFVGLRSVPARNRVGLGLFALPAVLHVTALVASRGGWLHRGWMTPDRLSAWGEDAMLLAAVTAPLLLLPRGVPRQRVVTALALGAGVSSFFFVASIGRPDLVQAVGLYTVHLDLPRGLSASGIAYALALFGFTVALVVSLLSPGGTRLGGLGLALIAMGGYQTGSPVELALTLGGLLALGTGLSRVDAGGLAAPLSALAWRAMLGTLGAAIADSTSPGSPPVLVEVTAGGEDGADDAVVRASRRGRGIALQLRRLKSAVRELRITVGVPPETPPDATIEPHEVWLGRRPEDRPSLPRVKTGDPPFDRKLGVYGAAPLGDQALRRRLLTEVDGTVTLWAGTAARFVSPASALASGRSWAWPAGPGAIRPLVELVDTLGALVQSSEPATPPPG